MLCSGLTDSKLRGVYSWLTMVTIPLALAMTAFPGTPTCCLRHDSVSAGLARKRGNVLPCLPPSYSGVTDSLPSIAAGEQTLLTVLWGVSIFRCIL